MEGANARIEGCTVSSISDHGIDVSGDGAVIRGNRVFDIVDDTRGIEYTGGTTSGTLIEGNTVSDTAEEGIYVSAGGVTIRGNTLTFCGTEGDASIRSTGSNNVIEDNRIFDADDPGIEVTGASNTVRNCTVTRSFDDGIDVFGDGNTVTGCTVTACDGEGLVNRGTNTTVTNSRFTGSRLDISINNGATFAAFTGVTFVTGGQDVLEQVSK